jgi:GAF domain-containing protein
MGRDNLDLMVGSRYRALLGVSTAIASQPDVQAVLCSISALLSKIVPFDSIALLLLNPQNQTTVLYALEAGKYDPGIEIGTEAPFKNTAVGLVLEQQKPVFIPDIQQEWLKIPQFAQIPSRGPQGVLSSYIFPISSSRRKLGALVLGTLGREQYSDADVELMGSVAAHVSIALENALARRRGSLPAGTRTRAGQTQPSAGDQ